MAKLDKLTWIDPTDIKCFRNWLSSSRMTTMSLKHREDSIKLIRMLIRISLILTNPEFSLLDELAPEESGADPENL